jgi:hypothetical protein
MAIGSFELDELFMIHVPLLVMFCHGSQKALLGRKDQSGWMWMRDRKKKKRAVVNAQGQQEK